MQEYQTTNGKKKNVLSYKLAIHTGQIRKSSRERIKKKKKNPNFFHYALNIIPIPL